MRETINRDDLISRKDALNLSCIITWRVGDVSSVIKACFEAYRDHIESLPSAGAVQGWIPVEEQPPVFPCLVCDANGNQPSVPMGIVTITDEEHGEWHIDGRLWDSPKVFVYGEWGGQLCYGNRIIAWMPLPTPYKGGDDE